MNPLTILTGLGDRAAATATEIKAIGIGRQSGLLGGQSPADLVRTLRDLGRMGAVASAMAKAAREHGDRPAVIDELGTMTYTELNNAINAVANAWIAKGVEAGDGVAILARNSRWFLIAFYAAGKIGARIVLLNTDFAGPQVREVAEREGTHLLVHDEEYEAHLEGIDPGKGRLLAWSDDADRTEATIASLVEGGDTSSPPIPDTKMKIVILTSGTTGTPKGAPRAEPKGVTPVAALLERAPFRSGDRVEICAPMFHSLGLAFTLLNVAMASTLVIRRHFDAEAVVDSLESNACRGMVLVPVMFSRVLQAWDARDEPKAPDLEVVLLGGSQLGSELAERGLRTLGPVLYNLYGSTEVAYATMATPSDLEAAPSTIGRPVLGTRVEIIGDDDHPLPQGETGRIFVRNVLPFDGYTGGGTKTIVDGMMATGDVGHFDENGRLFVDGRDDEMLVSGGENVYPREVEELLEGHPAVNEVAIIDVPDDQWGQRLRAFVVLESGQEASEEDLKQHVKENLARFKVPRDVEFIDELPRNATGKVLKRVLREHE